MTAKTDVELAAWTKAEDAFWKGKKLTGSRVRSKYSEEDRKKVKELLSAGFSVRVVAERLNLSKSVVSRLKNQ